MFTGTDGYCTILMMEQWSVEFLATIWTKDRKGYPCDHYTSWFLACDEHVLVRKEDLGQFASLCKEFELGKQDMYQLAAGASLGQQKWSDSDCDGHVGAKRQGWQKI